MLPASFYGARTVLDRAVLDAFGDPVQYHSQTDGDLLIRALPADQTPEDKMPGIYTVREIETSDVPSGPATGDYVVLNGTVYTVFAVREKDASSMSRVFLTKNKDA